MRLIRFVEFSRKIIAVGRNYIEHAQELNNAVPDKPLIFLKPSTAYVTEGSPIKIPDGCTNFHHEVEMGVIIGKKCSKIAECEAADYIGGITLALDMTARDLQDELKAKGHPWSIAKGFDTSCPVGSFVPKEQIQNLERLRIWCKVNDQLRQSGETDKMIFKLNYLISYISKYFTLEVGDLILTGTPKGVGPVNSGDIIHCGLVDLSNDKQLIEMKFDVK